MCVWTIKVCSLRFILILAVCMYTHYVLGMHTFYIREGFPKYSLSRGGVLYYLRTGGIFPLSLSLSGQLPSCVSERIASVFCVSCFKCLKYHCGRSVRLLPAILHGPINWLPHLIMVAYGTPLEPKLSGLAQCTYIPHLYCRSN